jgi:hypothetical protein
MLVRNYVKEDLNNRLCQTPTSILEGESMAGARGKPMTIQSWTFLSDVQLDRARPCSTICK